MANPTLSQFRLQIREGILSDNPTDITKRRWSDAQLNNFIGWALNTLCSHTAVATATAFTSVTGTYIDMPDNVYDELEKTSRVILSNASGRPEYLDPVNYTQGVAPGATGRFYYELPRGRINFVTEIVNPITVTVQYFAYYNVPVNDSDTIDVPQWALAALSYLIGAHAMSNLGTRSATIRQWGERPETGQPEHNPFRAQQKYFMEHYEHELARIPRQDRANFFRKPR